MSQQDLSDFFHYMASRFKLPFMDFVALLYSLKRRTKSPALQKRIEREMTSASLTYKGDFPEIDAEIKKLRG